MHRVKWMLMAALVAVALIAAACGDGDDDTASSESTEETTESTEAGDTATTEADATGTTEAEATGTTGTATGGECETVDEVSVTLQWLTQSQFAGYFAARDEGYYEEFCLDVEIIEGGIDIVPQQQVGSGAADFGLAWVPKALVSREEGIDVVNVAQVFQRSATLQVAFADAAIDGPEDFAGKQIGNWGGGNEFELVAGARQAGLEPGTDFDFVQQDFTMQALINGEIDAAQAMTYNEYAQVLETVNPDTGELFQPEDLTVIDWNEVGTAMLQDADLDGRRVARQRPGVGRRRHPLHRRVDQGLGVLPRQLRRLRADRARQRLRSSASRTRRGSSTRSTP